MKIVSNFVGYVMYFLEEIRDERAQGNFLDVSVNWKFKALLQQAIGLLPNREYFNYLCQRHLTRTLPHPRWEFFFRIEVALKHLTRYSRSSPNVALKDSSFYEFGAGWSLIGPLTYYFSGVGSQTLIDQYPHANPEIINHTLETFRRERDELKRRGLEISRPIRPLTSKHPQNELKEHYGIAYRAPLDACDTRLSAESFDFLSSTYVLEHVGRRLIVPLLRECRRLLKEGGVGSFEIDYRDHYCDFDKTITPYHFLRYPEEIWRFWNPRLQHQNRCRHGDYVGFFNQAGFEIASIECEKPTEEQIRMLAGTPLSEEFIGRPQEDLGITGAGILVKKNRRAVKAPD